MQVRRLVMASAGLLAAVGLFPAALSAQEPAGDIVETADAAGQFTTLLAAAEAAGLVETLKGEGPFTVFAPTDEAFAALPAGTVDGLLADPAALRQVLLYHVVSGEVLAADVVGLDSATTVQGSDIEIAVSGGTVTLNGNVAVTATDVMASNGVIHVIDGVLLPPSADAPASPAAPSPAAAGNAGLNADAGTGAGTWAIVAMAAVGAVLLGSVALQTRRSRSR